MSPALGTKYPLPRQTRFIIVKEAPNEFAWYRNPGELRMADLNSGRSEPLVRGLPALDYDISADGQQVVMWTTDREGKPRLWAVPLDRSSPPVQIPNVEGAQPRFLPGGDILFRHLEGMSTLFTAFTRTALDCGRRSQKRCFFCTLFHQRAAGSMPGLRFPAMDHLQFRPSRWTGGLQSNSETSSK